MMNNMLNEAIDLIDDDLISNAYSNKNIGKSYKDPSLFSPICP